MELDWTTATVGGVTLVRVCLENQRAVERGVRLRNLLDGPVLPPRRQREPEAGWDRDGVTVTVPAGGSVGRGYACPAPSADPPVEIVAVGAPGEFAGTDEPVGEVIRDLGDARPPRAVLDDTQLSGDEETIASEDHSVDDQEPVVRERSDEGPAEPARRELPPALEDAIEPYRRRLETVETLGIASVPEATELLDTTGGIGGVERVGAQLETDASELCTLAAEAAALAARAEAATPPLDALRRLS